MYNGWPILDIETLNELPYKNLLKEPTYTQPSLSYIVSLLQARNTNAALMPQSSALTTPEIWSVLSATVALLMCRLILLCRSILSGIWA
jgi:hypothetical protein